MWLVSSNIAEKTKGEKKRKTLRFMQGEIMMKGEKKLTAILATLLLTISLFMAIPFPAHAAPGAELIFPEKTDLSPKVQIGGTTSIAIKVNTTERVFNWTISFTFNNSFLMYLPAYTIEGLFLKQNGTTTFNPGAASGNQVTGLNCSHGAGNFTKGIGDPDSMDQILVLLVFYVLGYGPSEMEFVSGQCSMYDDAGSAIALTFTDGSLEVEGKVTVELEDVYLTTATHSTGDTYTMDLTIDTEEYISSWEGGFRYDPTILNCTAVTYGTFFGAASNNSGTIHPTNGTAWGFGQSLSGSSVTGTGTLASLVFKILNYGKTTVDLSLLDGETIEFKVKDRWGVECTNVDLVDGSLESRAGVAVMLPYIAAWPSPGSTLVVNLKIASAEKVTSWQAGIVFDNTALNCTDVTYGTYFNPAWSPFNLTYTIDNAGGKVTGMGQVLFGGLYTTGNGILATITFNVTGAWRLLNVTDVDLAPNEVIVADQNADECTVLQLVPGLKVYGDVDRNSKVDPTDVFSYVALAYGGSIGQSKYDANCDFDADGDVDPTDVFSYLATYYNPTVTYPYW